MPPTDEKDIRKYLPAFADGELEVEQNLRVLEHMAMNPRATRRVMHQQQLRQAVDQSVRGATPATPEALKRKIARMANEAGDSDAAAPIRRARFRLAAWVPTAIAALLLIGAGVLYYAAATRSAGVGNTRVAARPSLAMELPVLNDLIAKHELCVHPLEELYNGAIFPREIENVPAAVRNVFGKDSYTLLDLTDLGYRYADAGVCPIGSGKAVHVLYRKINNPTDRISLWIEPDDGHLDIKRDTPYAVTGKQTSHPIIMWCHGGMTYYLVSDSAATTEAALARIRG